MSAIIEIFSAALQLAIVYWIVNLGFVYLYRTTGILNFAQGQMLMVGAFVLVFLTQKLGLGLPIALPLVLVLSVFFGIAIYYLSLRLLGGSHQYVKVIGTFLVAIILTQVVGLIWGINSYVISAPNLGLIRFGGGTIPVLTIVTAVALLTLIGVAEYFVVHAKWGVAMRAAASNGSLVMYYGIRNNRLGAAAWAIGFVCATLGGLIYIESGPVVYGMAAVGFAAFPAAVIGGMDSVPGSIVGGMVVALIQSIASFYFGGSVSDAVSFLLVVIVLVVRPYGLLGKARSNRL